MGIEIVQNILVKRKFNFHHTSYQKTELSHKTIFMQPHIFDFKTKSYKYNITINKQHNSSFNKIYKNKKIC